MDHKGVADDQNLQRPAFLVSTHVIGRHSFKNKENKIIAYEKSSIHGGLVYGINTAIIFISKGDNHGCRDVTG